MRTHADSQLTPTQYVEMAQATLRSPEHRGSRRIIKAKALDGTSMLAMHQMDTPTGAVFEIAEQRVLDREATFSHAYTEETDAEAVWAHLLEVLASGE